ncbi:MAG: S24 family peptidase, partial [Bdellovibrionales bacterium]
LDPSAEGGFDLPLLTLEEAAGVKDLSQAVHGLKIKAPAGRLSIALQITDNAYAPAYKTGDKLILSPADTLRREDHILIRTKAGEALFRKIGREGAQKIELLALSPDTPPLTLSRSDIEWIYKVGWVSR